MDMTPHFPIYMDYGATTPVDPRLVDAMIPWLREHFGNPASRSHAWGWEAEAALETEHKAVLDTMRELERQGFEVTYMDVQEDGLLDLGAFKAALRPDTPRRRPTGRGHRRAVRPPQAARAPGSADARRRPRARHAFGHAAHAPDRQHGEAFRLAKLEMAQDDAKSAALHKRLLEVLKGIEQVFINGTSEPGRRVAQNLNMSFNFVEGESLIIGIKGLAVSSGSACTSASLEPSYVLRALGRSDELAHSSLRMTLHDRGRNGLRRRGDQEERHQAARTQPPWKMYQDGVDLSTIQWTAH